MSKRKTENESLSCKKIKITKEDQEPTEEIKTMSPTRDMCEDDKVEDTDGKNEENENEDKGLDKRNRENKGPSKPNRAMKQKLMDVLLKHSVSKNFDDACQEWELGRSEVDVHSRRSCICGQANLCYCFYIRKKNKSDSTELLIGSDCIGRFSGNSSLKTKLNVQLKKLQKQEDIRKRNVIQKGLVQVPEGALWNETHWKQSEDKWEWMNHGIHTGLVECLCGQTFAKAKYIRIRLKDDHKTIVNLDLSCATNYLWSATSNEINETLAGTGKRIQCGKCHKFKQRTVHHANHSLTNFICSKCAAKQKCVGCDFKGASFFDMVTDTCWCSHCYKKRAECMHCDGPCLAKEDEDAICAACIKKKHSCSQCDAILYTDHPCCEECKTTCTKCDKIFEPDEKGQRWCNTCLGKVPCPTCSKPYLPCPERKTCLQCRPTCPRCKEKFDPKKNKAGREYKVCKNCYHLKECETCGKWFEPKSRRFKNIKCPTCYYGKKKQAETNALETGLLSETKKSDTKICEGCQQSFTPKNKSHPRCYSCWKASH